MLSPNAIHQRSPKTGPRPSSPVLPARLVTEVLSSFKNLLFRVRDTLSPISNPAFNHFVQDLLNSLTECTQLHSPSLPVIKSILEEVEQFAAEWERNNPKDAARFSDISRGWLVYLSKFIHAIASSPHLRPLDGEEAETNVNFIITKLNGYIGALEDKGNRLNIMFLCMLLEMNITKLQNVDLVAAQLTIIVKNVHTLGDSFKPSSLGDEHSIVGRSMVVLACSQTIAQIAHRRVPQFTAQLSSTTQPVISSAISILLSTPIASTLPLLKSSNPSINLMALTTLNTLLKLLPKPTWSLIPKTPSYSLTQTLASIVHEHAASRLHSSLLTSYAFETLAIPPVLSTLVRVPALLHDALSSALLLLFKDPTKKRVSKSKFVLEYSIQRLAPLTLIAAFVVRVCSSQRRNSDQTVIDPKLINLLPDVKSTEDIVSTILMGSCKSFASQLTLLTVLEHAWSEYIAGIRSSCENGDAVVRAITVMDIKKCKRVVEQSMAEEARASQQLAGATQN